ncbi:MAG: RNA-guided endonuclease IscB [Ruminococcus flavefaciens]|nr:RNA-guided endonuclease IscB [Ruminococcus flavefaciens]
MRISIPAYPIVFCGKRLSAGPAQPAGCGILREAGYRHIGMSVKSGKREYLSAQYDLLTDEKERHDAQRKLRRSRRGRLRYRKPRFDNRKASKKEGWLAPSLKNKAGQHVELAARIIAVAPVTSVTLEMGEFDAQVLKAAAMGKPVPEGEGYQRGPRYGIETLRAAVFQRDGHQCVFCKRGIKDGAVLHAHHAYYWRGQHGSSPDELVACCEKCHIPKNHKEGGLLWGYDKELPKLAGAAFMNAVRWYIWHRLEERILGSAEMHMAYGAATKLARKDLGVEKSHANDAYAMGNLHPEERAETMYFRKLRRNNRILEKFYDAKYIDTRDGEKRSGSELGCQRANRREPRVSDKGQRIYHGAKVSKGRRVIRKKRYDIRPGDRIVFQGRWVTAKGMQNKGTRVVLDTGKSVSVKDIRRTVHTGGWVGYIPKTS